SRLTVDAGTRLRDGRPSAYRVHGLVAKLDPSRLHSSAPSGDLTGRLDAETNGTLSSADGSIRLRLSRSRIGSVDVRRFEMEALLTQGMEALTISGHTRFRR